MQPVSTLALSAGVWQEHKKCPINAGHSYLSYLRGFCIFTCNSHMEYNIIIICTIFLFFTGTNNICVFPTTMQYILQVVISTELSQK